ncbi:hypothetical protein CQA10_21790 [Escherichia coli]|nr:hypothetical protein CQA10_21790 [Escherichia coli]
MRRKGVGSVGSVGSICKEYCFIRILFFLLNQHNVTELMRTTPGWHQRVFYETFVKSCVQGRDVFESEHYEIFVVQKTAPEKLLCLFSKPSA